MASSTICVELKNISRKIRILFYGHLTHHPCGLGSCTPWSSNLLSQRSVHVLRALLCYNFNLFSYFILFYKRLHFHAVNFQESQVPKTETLKHNRSLTFLFIQ